MSVCLYIPGADAESRLLRKTMLRYCHLMLVLILRSISDSVKSRFSTLEDLVVSGIKIGAFYPLLTFFFD